MPEKKPENMLRKSEFFPNPMINTTNALFVIVLLL